MSLPGVHRRNPTDTKAQWPRHAWPFCCDHPTPRWQFPHRNQGTNAMSITSNDIVHLGPPTGSGQTTARARVRDLHVTFERRGVPLHALRGISLDVQPGEVLALVGESGSGKSVMGLALLGLLAGQPSPVVSGTAEVCGIDMVAASADERRRVRKTHLGAVFQDPMTSLDPTMRV